MRNLILLFVLVLLMNSITQAQNQYYVTEHVILQDDSTAIRTWNVAIHVTDTMLYIHTDYGKEYPNVVLETFYYYTTISGATVYSSEYSDMSMERLSASTFVVQEHTAVGAARRFEVQRVKKQNRKEIKSLMQKAITRWQTN